MFMRTLRLNMSGDDVKVWQNFLIVKQKASIVASGFFDEQTKTATVIFQIQNKLGSDGVVGALTYAAALKQGLPVVIDEDPNGLDKPLRPVGFSFISESAQDQIFGKIEFIAAPTVDNAEAIKITNDWVQKNIVSVEIPQLARLKNKSSYKISCHKLISNQLVSVFQAWDDAKLIDKILTWDGCWVPRFKRGSQTELSNHAHGTAFDINCQYNQLGTTGASWGEKGSVRELVDIAYNHGWGWGNWFTSRKDPMHFEIYKIK